MFYNHFILALVGNIEWLVTNGGYTLLFLITLLEGIPLVGMAVPGHIAILIAGFFSKIGTLDLYVVIIIASIGALCGDFMGFYLGKKYGLSLISRFSSYFFISDVQIDRAKSLLAKHSGKALILGRFTPATRALMPFLVGTTSASHGYFWFFNIIGGLLWVVSSVLIGYIFGSAYHVFSDYIGKLLVIVIIVVLIVIWGYRFVNNRFHIFRRYELFSLILNIISILVLAITIDKLTSSSFRLNFDVWINMCMEWLVKIHPSYIDVASLFSRIGDNTLLLSLSFIIGIIFIFKNRWRSALVLLLSVVSTSFLTYFMKELFLSPRPVNAIYEIVGSPSFPSGHSSLAVAFFFAIAYLIAPKIKSWFIREMMIVVSVLMFILIGLSRLVLNVHWSSDVIAGWALGLFSTTGTILFIRYISVLFMRQDNKYKLVIVRHGESEWNKENRFAGWVDVDLTSKGVEEAKIAGQSLKNKGFKFDIAFTSFLKRANRTLDLILEEMNIKGIEIIKSWKLNERHYGALQGMNKSETALKYGEEQVKLWRRGYDVAIPPLDKNSDMYPGKDPKYSSLSETEIPLSENLKDVVNRVVPFWIQDIVPEIRKGKRVIISASGNSLRALIKHLEKISDEDIVDVNIPTGIPLVYTLNEKLEVLDKRYLADENRLKEAIETVANQGKVKR